MADIAKQIVRTSLNLTDQDVLEVETWSHTTELASAIAREALKAGADVITKYLDDNIWMAYAVDMDERYVARKPPSLASLAETITAKVDLGGPEDPKVFDRTPPDRFEAFSTWLKELDDRERARHVRSVIVGLGQVTPARARKYGVSYAKWKRIVTSALGADLKKIAAAGQLVGKNLSGAPEVTVGAEGTDLTVSLSGREAFVFDGIVDAGDIARGNLSTNLPTGAASVAPLETSADGTVMFAQAPLFGKMIRNLRLTFERGRLVDFSADRNVERLRTLLDAAPGDKDRIGVLSIGLNPKATYLGGFVDNIVAGAVSVGIGSNDTLGGQNKTPFVFDATVRGATVRAGNAIIVDRGQLKA